LIKSPFIAQIYDPIIKLYRFVFKDKDVQWVVHHSFTSVSLMVYRYSTKLRALSDAQVEDFGAKLAVQRVEDNVPDASRASVAFSSDCSTSVGSASDTPFDGSSEFVRDSLNFDKLGLGEFLKEVEAQGVDAIQQQYMTDIVESPETKEMTPEQCVSRVKMSFTEKFHTRTGILISIHALIFKPYLK
jgi:hypothetical protein